jgi:hypothetical protein
MKTTCRSDWKEKYQKARRYALKYLSSGSNYHDLTNDPDDLVHSAYLYWLDNKKADMFDLSSGQIARIMKNIHRQQTHRSRWYWRGQTYNRSFSASLVTAERTEDQILSNWGFEFPTTNVESNDTIAFLRSKLDKFDNKVLNYKLAGYQAKEIQEKENTHGVKVTKSLKKIKKVMKEVLLNPFNCSKVKVLKKMTRKNYEANKAEYADFEFGEYAEHNEYYELLTSKANPKEGILIKEQMRD